MRQKTPKILLADDETHIRMLLKSLLTSMNYEVIAEARNGQEAVEQYRKMKPDMVLLDINMPVKTGQEVLKEIMADFPDALVIMLTSFADRETVTECISLGAANFIRKDTPVDQIKALIHETWQELLNSKETNA